MAAAVVPCSPLSPFSFWQDFLGSPATDDNSDDVTMTTIDHVSNALAITSNNPPDNATVNVINKNHTTPSSAMDAQSSVILAQSRPSCKPEQYGNPLEGNGIAAGMLLDMSKLPDHHPIPLNPSDSLVDYHQLSGFVSETSPLTALAAIAEQHPVHRSFTVLETACSGGSAANNADAASVSLSVNVSHVQPTAVDVTPQTSYRTPKVSRRASCEFADVSKVESRACDVCGEPASGHYFGALVCLPCKSFFIRCTKGGDPVFSADCGGKCDVIKSGRVRCQFCRFQKCLSAGMYRKEKPEAVVPEEGQVLCQVCSDIANGVHFGITTCEGCKKFFRRGLKEHQAYVCKATGNCTINPRMRNNCRYCRYQKCLRVGMSREAIKMGRPKKGDTSCWRPSKPPPMDTAARKLDTQSTVLSESAAEAAKEEDPEGTEEALENKFTLEAVYDSHCIADEFLEAVSLGLDQDDTPVKNEPSAKPVEVITVGSAVSMTPSPVDHGVPSRSNSSGSVSRSGPFSPHSEDTYLLQTCTYPTLSPAAASSSGFPQKQVHGGNPLPQPAAHPELSEWLAEEEAMSSNDSVTSAEYSDCGLTECCGAFSSPFLDGQVDECVMSPPCFCSPCSCSSPISDCESPCCKADYRSQLQYLPSPGPGQHFHRASRPQLPCVHDRPELMARQTYTPAVPHTYGDQLATPHHPFPPAPFPSLLRQGTDRKDPGQMSVIRRRHTPPSSLPYCFSDRPNVVGIPPVASSSHRSKPAQKLMEKVLEETFVDELSNLLESLRERSSVPTNTVKNTAIATPAHCTSSIKPVLKHTETSKHVYNRGISFESIERRDNRRRSSDSRLEFVPDNKFAKFCNHVNRSGYPREVAASWTSPSPMHYPPDALAGRRWSGTSTRQTGSKVMSFVSPAQQQYRGSGAAGLPRSFSHNSLYHSNRDLSSMGAVPQGVSRTPHLSFPYSDWQYGAHHYSALMKQGGGQHGNTAVQSLQDQTGLSPAGGAQFAARKVPVPSTSNAGEQAAVDSSNVAFSTGVMAGSHSDSRSVDPLARALSCLPSAVSHHLNSLPSVALTTTASGTNAGINITNSAAGFGNSTDAFKTRPASTNTLSGAIVTTSPTSLQPTTSAVHVSQQPSPGALGNVTSSHPNMPAVSTYQQQSPQMVAGQISPRPDRWAATVCPQRCSQKATNLPSGIQRSADEGFPLSLSPVSWPPVSCRPHVAGTPSPTCQATTHLSPLAADGAPTNQLLSCPTTCEGASSARSLTAVADSPGSITWDPRSLIGVNRYFLTLENTCEKNSCKQDSTDEEAETCQSQGCRGCPPSQDGGGQRFDSQWRGVCVKRCHRYWHGYRPSLQLAEVTGQKQQQYLGSVVSAFSQLHDDLRQLDSKSGIEGDQEERIVNTSELLQSLYQQGNAIAAMSRRFLLAIPGGSTIATEDVEMLSQRFGFSAALILLGSQGFDPEGRRFREVLRWTVGPTCPLFCFKVQLLAVASSIHALCMDRRESALLCALSLCSTDTWGLKDTEAIRAVRCQLLQAMETCVSTRDQGCRERVKRLFSVLPNVRLVTSWFCALLSLVQPSAVHPPVS